ncbi:MAG: hypothetical protein II237_01020 [Clostridia bacterium]|nr:hypothetical protein [Clostridia bacterium]
MEKLTLWIKISSVSAIVSAVMSGVLPESKLKKTYISLCSMLVLFSLFSAFVSFDAEEFNGFMNEEEISNVQSKSDELLVAEGEGIIEAFIYDKLKSEGIEARVRCTLTGADGESDLCNFTVYGMFDDGEKREIMRVIKENLKEVNEVIFVAEADE